MHDPTTRTGMKSVSNWQKEAIRTTYMCHNRREAAELLMIPTKTLDDLLWRAFKVLGVKSIDEAFARIKSDQIKTEVAE